MDKGVDDMIDSNIALHLSNLGDVVPLNINVDIGKTRKELEYFKDEWKQYNPRKPNPREGLSITSLDGKLSGIPDLDSLIEYNKLNNVRIKEIDINVRTPVAEKVESIKPLCRKLQGHFKTPVIRHYVIFSHSKSAQCVPPVSNSV